MANTTQSKRALKTERIYRWVDHYIREHGYGPSLRNIVDGCELSSTAVAEHHMRLLAKDGRIIREPGVSRSIRIVPDLTMFTMGEWLAEHYPDSRLSVQWTMVKPHFYNCQVAVAHPDGSEAQCGMSAVFYTGNHSDFRMRVERDLLRQLQTALEGISNG